MRISRKQIFWNWHSAALAYSVIIIIMLACLLAGCGDRSTHKTTIRFWNGFTGPDGRTMLGMIKRFNQENPDIHVTMQRMEWAMYYNKLFVAGIGNRAPEVFIIHAGNIERFMQANFLRPIDDLMAGPQGIDGNDFSENVWAALEKDGSHYGIPLDVHMLGMYYNKKLFREAGIVDERGEPKPPANRVEFVDALTRLTKDTNSDGRIDQWGYVFTWYRTNLYTFMHQWEGSFFTPDEKRCLLNDPGNIAALDFCSELLRDRKIAAPPENIDAWIGFRQGKVGIAFEGIYMLSDLIKQKDLEFGAAPLPVLGNVPAAWADSHTICLKNNLDAKTLEAAWRFAKFLSDNSLDWAEGGQVPVRKSLRDTERFRRMTTQYEFAKEIPYIRYVPRVPFIFEFLTEFDNAVEKSLLGSVRPKEALDDATDNINAILARRENMMQKKRPEQ